MRAGRVFALATAFACAASPVTPATISAQTSNGSASCVTNNGVPFPLWDACQKARDLFHFLVPQVGVALAGGNTMLGESGTLGGQGRSSFSLRLTAVDGFVPSNEVPLVIDGLLPSSNFGAQRAPIPMPTLDLATGVFAGRPRGLTNVGGIDLLVGLTYLPDFDKESVAIDARGMGVALSYGVRVGITQESALFPGISVSYRSRKTPTTNIRYLPNDDTLRVNDASISAQSYRITVGKHYKFIGVSGGYGSDDIRSSALFSAVVNSPQTVGRTEASLPATRLATTRRNAFLNIALGLPRAKLVGEVGWSAAGRDIPSLNTFDDHKANEKYRYYSLGFSYRP
ncbi:MAG: hypothetical protein ACO1Q7_14720 [Gemmatimonas sp.]